MKIYFFIRNFMELEKLNNIIHEKGGWHFSNNWKQREIQKK